MTLLQRLGALTLVAVGTIVPQASRRPQLPDAVPPRPSAADERLARIDAGLLPPINWKGERPATMTLRDRMAARLMQMGAMPGFIAYLVGYPELGQGAVIMVNAGRGGGRLARELARAVAVEYGWPEYVPVFERVTPSAEVLDAFAGQYEFVNPSYPKIRISRQGERLLWQDAEMVAVRGGTFVVPRWGIEVRFVRDAAGAVVAAEYAEPGMRRTRVARTGA